VHAELEEGPAAAPGCSKARREFLFEPGADQVLGLLLPHYLNFQVYQILLEAKPANTAPAWCHEEATDNALRSSKT